MDVREALIDARDNGLIYWEPNTARGHTQKALMLARIDTALAQSDAVPSDEPTIVDEAYQVIATLANTFGVFEHLDVVRALDRMAYGKTEDGLPLLPWPREHLRPQSDAQPDVRVTDTMVEVGLIALCRHTGESYPAPTEKDQQEAKEWVRVIIEAALAQSDAGPKHGVLEIAQKIVWRLKNGIANFAGNDAEAVKEIAYYLSQMASPALAQSDAQPVHHAASQDYWRRSRAADRSGK